MSAIPITGIKSRAADARAAHLRKLAQRELAARLALFCFVAGIGFLASSLSGQVMLEKARRDGLAAGARAREAKKQVAELRHRLDLMTTLTAVEDWAGSHGYAAPTSIPVSSSKREVVVALR